MAKTLLKSCVRVTSSAGHTQRRLSRTGTAPRNRRWRAQGRVDFNLISWRITNERVDSRGTRVVRIVRDIMHTKYTMYTDVLVYLPGVLLAKVPRSRVPGGRTRGGRAHKGARVSESNNIWNVKRFCIRARTVLARRVELPMKSISPRAY